MNCNNCNTNIPEEIIEIMLRTAGDKACCFVCGSLLKDTNKSNKLNSDYFDYNSLPYPLALVYERFTKGVKNNEPPLDILISFKDFVELLVKYSTIIQLSFALKENYINTINSTQILQSLARPSLGTWVDLLGVITKTIKANFVKTNSTHEILAIYDALFDYNPRKAEKKHEQKDSIKTIWEFVKFRNDVLGHGAKQSNSEYSAHVNAWNLTTQKWNELIIALSGIELRYGKSITDEGLLCQGIDFQFPNDNVSNKLSISFSDNTFYNLSPFIFINSCDSCKAQLLFFYDSDKNYGDKNPKINSLEYNGGHKSPLTYPIKGLEEIFGKKLLLDSFKPIRIRIAEIDSAIIKAPEIIKKHANIIGRDFLKDKVQEFLKQRAGVFILTATPGMGKTAFASYLIENGHVNSYFIYRRTSSSSSSDDFTKSTYYSILQNFGIVDNENTDNILALRVKLKNLLADISSKFLRKNEKCVILVDALDEGTTSRDGITTIQAIPFELPDNIYFILTSRPIKELDEVFIMPEVCHYKLEPLSPENITDGEMYLKSRLPNKIIELINLEKIVRVAEGNFLLLQLLTESVLADEIDPLDLEDEIAKMPGLKGYYARYWEILIQKCGDSRKDINLLNDVLGLMSISRSPLKEEIIIGVLTLTAGDYTWAIRQVRQFIDVIEEEEEKYLRLFHDTFRDFVRNQIFSNQRKYHLSIAHYFSGKTPQSTNSAYGLRHKAYHLAAAWDIDNLFEWITSAIEDYTATSRQMIIQTLDDLQRDRIILKKSQLKCNAKTTDILNKIYESFIEEKVKSVHSSINAYDKELDLRELAIELAKQGKVSEALSSLEAMVDESIKAQLLEKINVIIEQKKDEIDAFIILLHFVKSFHGLKGISVYFSYKLRELPTPIAIAAIPLANESNDYFRAVHRLIDMSEILMKFCSAVLFCQYYYFEEHNSNSKSQEFRSRILDFFKIPSLGAWCLLTKLVCDHLNLPFLNTFKRKRFKTIENGKENSYDDVFDLVIKKRNQYAHGSTLSDEQCQNDCDVIISALDMFIDQLAYFSDYKLVEILDQQAHKILVRYLVGEDKSLTKTEWIDIPNKIIEKADIYIILPDTTIAPILFIDLSIDESGIPIFSWYKDLTKDGVEFYDYSNSKSYTREINDNSPSLFKKIIQAANNYKQKTLKNNWLFTGQMNALNNKFKGRKEELDFIKKFIKNKNNGYLIISGPIGIGKSALISSFPGHSLIGLGAFVRGFVRGFIYFVRKGTANAETNYFLKYLNEQIDVIFPDGKIITAAGNTNFDLKIQLFNKWKEYAESDSTCKLIYFIDGLDEGDAEFIKYLPTELFEKILFIFSTKKNDVIIQYLNEINPVNLTYLELEGLTKIAVQTLISEYVNKYKIHNEWVDAIMKISNGHPLYIRFLCKCIETQELVVNDISSLPKNLDEVLNQIGIIRKIGDG